MRRMRVLEGIFTHGVQTGLALRGRLGRNESMFIRGGQTAERKDEKK
jgi:hypothetical protein